MERRRRPSPAAAIGSGAFCTAGVPAGLALVVGLTALALGGGRLWASAPLQISIFVLAWIWFRSASRTVGVTPAFRQVAVVATLLGFFLVLQTVPLPEPVLRRVSPTTAEVYRATVVSVETAPAQPPVGDRPPAMAPAWRPMALHPFATRAALLRYVAFFLALWIAATSTRPALLLRSLIAVGGGIALLALVQDATWNGRILWIFEPYEGDVSTNRMLGPFINPNLLAAFLAMILPATAGVLADEVRRTARPVTGRTVLLALSIVIVAAALIGTASRGALLGLALGLFSALPVLLLTHPETLHPLRPLAKSFLSVRGISAASTIVVLVLSGCLLVGPDARSVLVERFQELLAEPNASGGSRIDYWKQTLRIAGDFPLFGVGAGNWPEIFRSYQSYPLTGLLPNHAHNDYLEWFIEVGGVGALLTLLLIAAVARWLAPNRAVPLGVRWGLVAAIGAVLFHEVVDFPLRTPANALLLACLVGLAGNPHWSASFGTDGSGRRPGRRATLAVTIGLGILASASLWQLLEFAQWSRAVAGSTETILPPRYAPTWAVIGKTLRERGDRSGATAAYRTAIGLRPADPYGYWGLVLATTDPELGRRSLDTAIRLHPTRAIWRATRALWLDERGRTGAALAEIGKAAYLDPRPAHHPYLVAGKSGTLSPAVVDAALRGFRRAADAHPDDAGLQIDVADLHDRLGAPGEAATLRSRAARLRPDDDEHQFHVGRAFYRAGEYTGAAEAFRRCIEANPGHASYHYFLAKSLQQVGDPEGALAGYRRAAALKSGKALYRRKAGEVERLIREDRATRPDEALLP